MNVRVRYLDRDGVAHDEVKRGLTAGTFQHEVDHLDGVLFVDRVRDPRTFTTWEQFERFHRAAFVDRITEFVRSASGRDARIWCELRLARRRRRRRRRRDRGRRRADRDA